MEITNDANKFISRRTKENTLLEMVAGEILMVFTGLLDALMMLLMSADTGLVQPKLKLQ